MTDRVRDTLSTMQRRTYDACVVVACSRYGELTANERTPLLYGFV